MILPTLVFQKQFLTDPKLTYSRFLCSSIDGVSEDIKFSLVGKGILVNFSVSCSSTHFDVSIRTRPEVATPSISEILFYVQEDRNLSDDQVHIYWVTEDQTDHSLYGVVTNYDPLGTGPILFDFVYSIVN